MRLAILASGSAGNALVVESDGTRLLIDCGLGPRQLRQRLRAVDLDLATLDAVLVSHEHVDHVRGLAALTNGRRLPVFATAGTAAGLPEPVDLTAALVAGVELRVGGLVVLPIATSHDAAEPVAFVLTQGSCRVGIVTDSGMIGPALMETLSGCHALLLETNHDADMLRLGPYPWPLKQRIASEKGHLSNEQACRAIEELVHDGLEVIVGMHLSRENNTPDIVLGEIARVVAGSAVRVAAAHQDRPMSVEIGGPRRQRTQLNLFEPGPR
jgi:phosphoribosyl 1,2-cyclic phosphodiesterase